MDDMLEVEEGLCIRRRIQLVYGRQASMYVEIIR